MQVLATRRAFQPERDDAAGVAWAVDVGQAQCDHLQPATRGGYAAGHLAGGFARAIGILGGERRAFVNGQALWLPVDLTRGGED